MQVFFFNPDLQWGGRLGGRDDSVGGARPPMPPLSYATGGARTVGGRADNAPTLCPPPGAPYPAELKEHPGGGV